MKQHWMKRLALMMVLVMTVGCMPIAYAGSASDTGKHWAEETIGQWTSMGYVKNFGDGSFKPDLPMTRADFMEMINAMYGFTEEKDMTFKDVSSSDRYYLTIRRAFSAGYIGGFPDGTMKPMNPITRAEAAVIFAKLEKLTPDESAAKIFKDWQTGFKGSAGPIGAVVKLGLFKGYPEGTYKPNASITRAEAVTVTSQLGTNRTGVYPIAGTYGPATGTEVVNRSVLIKAGDTTLRNLIVKGNLVVDEKVGEGTVDLNNVIVEGSTYIKGGGKDSVKINGGSYGKIFVMKTADTPVRLLVVNVKNADVYIPPEAGSGQVVLEGTFNSVSVQAANAKIQTQGNTTINEIRVEKQSFNVQMVVGGQTVVATLKADVVFTVLGQGRIITADVTVTGITYEKPPEKVNQFPPNTQVANTPTTTPPTTPTTTTPTTPPTTTPTTTPASGGGGGGGGGSSSNDDGGSSSSSTAVTAITVTGSGGVSTITNGATLQMSAAVSPNTATNQSVAWSVINGTGTANISNTGLLSSLTVGTVTVKATAQDGSNVFGQAVITIQAAGAGTVIFTRVTSYGLPTTVVKVQVGGSYVNDFSVYFDGALLTTTANGMAVVPVGTLNNLNRIQIQYQGTLRSVTSGGTW